VRETGPIQHFLSFLGASLRGASERERVHSTPRAGIPAVIVPCHRPSASRSDHSPGNNGGKSPTVEYSGTVECASSTANIVSVRKALETVFPTLLNFPHSLVGWCDSVTAETRVSYVTGQPRDHGDDDPTAMVFKFRLEVDAGMRFADSRTQNYREPQAAQSGNYRT